MCQLSLPTALGPLSIFPCLLREGWIPLSEQYPHASLGVFKAFISSSWRWQSCIHRLKTGPHRVWHKSVFLWGFPLQRIVGRGICAVKPIKLKHYTGSEIPETMSLSSQLLLHRSLLFFLLFFFLMRFCVCFTVQIMRLRCRWPWCWRKVASFVAFIIGEWKKTQSTVSF